MGHATIDLDRANQFIAVNKRAIIVMRGIMGSGKSTVAKWIDNEHGATAIVSADHYFTNDNVYKFDGAKLGAAHQRCKSLYMSWISYVQTDVGSIEYGRTAVVDNTGLNIRDINAYTDLARDAGIPYEIWSIQPQADLARSVHSIPAHAAQRALTKFTATEAQVSTLPGYRAISQEVVNLMFNQMQGI